MRIGVMVLAGFLFASAAGADTIVEDFEDGTLDPRFREVTHPFLTNTITDQFEIAGVSPGPSTAGFETDFLIVGDFTVSVDATRIATTRGALGIVLLTGAGSTVADIFYGRNGRIASIFFLPSFAPIAFPPFVPEDTATLRIRRIGTTIDLAFDVGGGFLIQKSATNAIYADPLRARFFLQHENRTSFPFVAGNFDNVLIEANGLPTLPGGGGTPAPIPEPTTVTLLAGALAAAACARRRKRAGQGGPART